MAKLVMSLEISGNQDAAICISRPSEYIGAIFGEVFETGFAQKFIWYPELVLFFPPGRLGSYWTEIYISDTLELQSETIRAIVVPFTTRSEFEPLLVSNKCDEGSVFYLGREGNYQLLFEARYLTINEASRLAGFNWYTSEMSENPRKSAPELIRFTFIPSVEFSEPQILRAEAGFNPPHTLSLNPAYEEPPNSHRTDVPLILSSYVIPLTLEFVGICEQTLQEFYRIERPRAQIRRASAFGDPENPVWADFFDISSVHPFSISIERDGSITLGEIAWDGFGEIHHIIWQLKHTGEKGFSWEAYYPSLVRRDAEELQQLLLLLKEKAKIHFQSNL
jgi:hypothetical protein